MFLELGKNFNRIHYEFIFSSHSFYSHLTKYLIRIFYGFPDNLPHTSRLGRPGASSVLSSRPARNFRKHQATMAVGHSAGAMQGNDVVFPLWWLITVNPVDSVF